MSEELNNLIKNVHGSIENRINAAYNLGKKDGMSKWIPVKERLPEKLDDVLICFADAEDEYDVAYMRKTFDKVYKDTGAENEWVSSMGETTYADYEVIAWMPIEPYREDGDTE